MKPISIDGRKIGVNYPPYIIAELSANHNGVLNKALDTISEAKKRGADAIKLQTYSADTMTIDCDREDFIIKGGLWDGYQLYQLYQEAQTPFDWHKEMFKHAEEVGITCFSTPFDETAVNLLEDLNTPAYKVASFEATDLPLIRYIASTKKPMIISTGMANLEDVKKIKTYKTLKGLKFIEFPKLGFLELDKIVKKIYNLSGGILLIDYGYLNVINRSTLQTVMKNKKMNMNHLFKNLGRADITSLVNFSLLKEYFLKNKLKVKKIVSQKFFLEKMGIIERAKVLEKNMTFKQKDYMSLTLTRLLHKELMGGLFKVIFAFKSKNSSFLGFK